MVLTDRETRITNWIMKDLALSHDEVKGKMQVKVRNLPFMSVLLWGRGKSKGSMLH